MAKRYSSVEGMGLKKFWKNKRVLITGHTGFKGSWLSLWLASLGAEIVGYSLPPPTNPSLFLLAKVQRDCSASVLGDVRDIKNLENVIKRYEPQIIFHLAAQSLVKKSYLDPHETFSINIMGTLNVMEILRIHKGNTKVLINITSDKCYENKEKISGYKETDCLGGHDPYSASKGSAELITTSFRNSFFPAHGYKKHHLAVASARAGNVIGGGDWAENRLIPDVVKALSDGKFLKIRYPKAVRPWQHVLDPLGGYLLLAEKLYNDGADYAEAWNFGPNNKANRTVEEVINILNKNLKQKIKYTVEQNKKSETHETTILKLNCTKTRSRLGWQPRLSLEKALQWTAEWYNVFLDLDKDNLRDLTLNQIKRYESIKF